MRPSKLRFPDKTAPTFKLFSLICCSISGVSGPELPIQVDAFSHEI